VTLSAVSPGQVYTIRCQGSTTGSSGFGAYGLQVNFGSLSQSPISAPNTTVAAAADQGGGTIGDARRITVGTLSGMGDAMMVDDAAEASLDMQGPGEVAPWAPFWQPPRPITVFGPALGTDQANQNLLTTLDFWSSNDHGNVIFSTLFQSENRRPTSMHYKTGDRALDGTRPDPLG
jgi:hypothetical protein